MNEDYYQQSRLFDFSDPTASNTLELFPEVWQATEALAAPQPEQRRAALERLIELDAIRFSPLAAYVLATRLIDPDLALRQQVVSILGEIYAAQEEHSSPEVVRQHIRGYLLQLSRRGLLPILEVAQADPATESAVAGLLNASPQVGDLLAEVIADRKVNLELRRQAIYFIAKVGYLQAIPALERLQERIEMRLNGQKVMPFVSTYDLDEASLLSTVQATLAILRDS
ncbi:MAG: hypothetical protein JW862_11830 [Anaerolineales bacterium]|nr:hypothetical protein [Anaerolineales bacterium]